MASSWQRDWHKRSVQNKTMVAEVEVYLLPSRIASVHSFVAGVTRNERRLGLWFGGGSQRGVICRQ